VGQRAKIPGRNLFVLGEKEGWDRRLQMTSGLGYEVKEYKENRYLNEESGDT